METETGVFGTDVPGVHVPVESVVVAAVVVVDIPHEGAAGGGFVGCRVGYYHAGSDVGAVDA